MESITQFQTKAQISSITATAKLDVDDYIRNIFLTNHRLWVLQTWIGNIDEFYKAIRSSIERGLEVKIAVLNPTSKHLLNRATELKMSEEEVQEKIFHTLFVLSSLAKDYY